MEQNDDTKQIKQMDVSDNMHSAVIIYNLAQFGT